MSATVSRPDGSLAEVPEAALERRPLPPPPPIREIRALAFLDRWPPGVFANLLIAAMAAGDAASVGAMLRMTAAATINLDDPELAPRLAALVAAGALTEAERDRILADGAPAEAP